MADPGISDTRDLVTAKVELSQENADYLVDRERRYGTSIAKTLADSLELIRIYNEMMEEGGCLVVVSSTGEKSKILLER